MRLLFWVTAIAGSLVFWLAPYPPMTDLPQHAAQVQMWRELLNHTSPWESLLQIHLLTPYLLGYGLALPLSFVLPIAAALKLLLSLAYLAFIGSCVMLRRQFVGDPRLDWLFLLGYFGAAYEWGFLTFLVAAPLGIMFVGLAARHAEQRVTRTALAVVAVGVLLLFSHGLVFAYAFLVAVLLHATVVGLRHLHWRDAAPYVVLGCSAVALFLVGRAFEAHYRGPAEPFALHFGLGRLDSIKWALGLKGHTLQLLMILGLAAPWLLGSRPDRRRLTAAVPLFVALGMVALLPHIAMGSSFIYHRFALFLIPAYAWTFPRPPATSTRTEPRGHLLRALAVPLMVIACWGTIAKNGLAVWRFAQESSEFDTLLQAAEPRQRALSLMFDVDSPAGNNSSAYLHFPVWYQALKGGFVDFNFAWFRPQVVRFRPERAPTAASGFEWSPGSFDWHKHHGDEYRYFFVRGATSPPETIFHNAPCVPRAIASRGPWTLYERRSCGPSIAATRR